MTRIYNHGIYLLCDGKDMLVNLGEEDTYELETETVPPPSKLK